MRNHDLKELLAAVRASIERLTDSRIGDERTLTRALAHLWSAHDELEMLAKERPIARAS